MSDNSASMLMRKQWFVSSKTSKIEEEYVFKESLGNGYHGKLYRAESRSSRQSYLVKVTQKNRVKNIRSFVKEAGILKSLDHPNIVNIYETFESERLLFLVKEYCSGEEILSKVIRENRLCEAEASLIMRKLFSAVAYCHSQEVCLSLIHI